MTIGRGTGGDRSYRFSGLEKKSNLSFLSLFSVHSFVKKLALDFPFSAVHSLSSESKAERDESVLRRCKVADVGLLFNTAPTDY